jgi:hypothetical protein
MSKIAKTTAKQIARSKIFQEVSDFKIGIENPRTIERSLSSKFKEDCLDEKHRSCTCVSLYEIDSIDS